MNEQSFPLDIISGLSLSERLQDVIQAIPQQRQTQESLLDQMRLLYACANRLGLYDAADYVAHSIPERNRSIGDKPYK